MHSTTFPLMPAPRTLLPTKNSSSKGVVLTTRGGRGLGKFGPLLPILEEEIRIQPSHRTLVCCTGGLWQMGIPGSRTQLSAGGFCGQFSPVQANRWRCCTHCTPQHIYCAWPTKLPSRIIILPSRRTYFPSLLFTIAKSQT